MRVRKASGSRSPRPVSNRAMAKGSSTAGTACVGGKAVEVRPSGARPRGARVPGRGAAGLWPCVRHAPHNHGPSASATRSASRVSASCERGTSQVSVRAVRAAGSSLQRDRALSRRAQSRGIAFRGGDAELAVGRNIGGDHVQAHSEGLPDAEVCTLPLGQADVEIAGRVEFGHLGVGDVLKNGGRHCANTRRRRHRPPPRDGERRATEKPGTA